MKKYILVLMVLVSYFGYSQCNNIIFKQDSVTKKFTSYTPKSLPISFLRINEQDGTNQMYLNLLTFKSDAYLSGGTYIEFNDGNTYFDVEQKIELKILKKENRDILGFFASIKITKWLKEKLLKEKIKYFKIGNIKYNIKNGQKYIDLLKCLNNNSHSKIK